ncbi:endonuclease domain-containing protein [Ponticaulis koreensis]|uniref:endonuclease domain-containing protein n=1 Tax=Ponticaulis koreensis TaxID=1123045 RepID=UPI0003B5E458|nr:endonuclease domain-containing protein [Ponticaulis koreensis]
MSEPTKRARKLRKASTSAEDAAWQKLRHFRKIGYPVRRQHPIGDFIVDFAITSVRLAIELDGGIRSLPADKAKDETREADLKERGWRILRIPNDQAFHPEHLHQLVTSALQDLD